MHASELLLLCSLGANPDSATMNATEQLSVTLLTPAQDCSVPFDVGVYFRLEPEWYLYWMNPGDAGLPVAVTWSLPPGFHAGPAEYPTPEKIIHGDVLSYGFHKELLLTVRITPPSGYTPSRGDTLTAQIDWLVCKESCIPGATSVSLDINERNIAKQLTASELFSRNADRRPMDAKDIGIRITSARLTSGVDGSRVIVDFEAMGGVTPTDFYPETLEDYVIDHKRITVSAGTISVPVTPYSPASSISSLRGLLMVGNRGYKLSIPIDKQ